MTTDEIRKLHAARPFEPFILHLADGRKIRVDHPEFMMQSPGGRMIYIAAADGGVDRIDLLLVVSAETIGTSKRPRRRRAS